MSSISPNATWNDDDNDNDDDDDDDNDDDDNDDDVDDDGWAGESLKSIAFFTDSRYYSRYQSNIVWINIIN